MQASIKKLLEEQFPGRFTCAPGTQGYAKGLNIRCVDRDGYAFVYDQAAGEFTRRSQRRTQLFGIAGAGFVITVLPTTVDIESVHYENDTNGRRIVTDGGDFQLNVSEFSASH